MGDTTRKKIGIIFNFEKSWLGGVYYLINIIKSLNSLDDYERPEIYLFFNPSLSDFVSEIEYPFLKAISWQFPKVNEAYIKSTLLRKNIFIDKIVDQYDLDGLYPVNDQPVYSKNSHKKQVKLISWYADLQHKFYPEFFSRKKIFFRELKIKLLLKNTDDLVVSSHDVKGHFLKFYNIKKRLRIHELSFVSIIDDFNFENIAELREKYKLPKNYFIISNQFYRHKNHIIVFKALSKIKEMGYNKVHVVMTGKMELNNNPEFIQILRDEISNNGLESYLSMLGVVPRKDQLCLMKHANAVIQPSLFEGWSTVIEDAKSLQVPVIASNIAIHNEQLEKKGTYFDPKNDDELSKILISFNNGVDEILYEKYDIRVKRFAKKFVNLFN